MWLVGQFAEIGAEARIEAESAHGTSNYHWPTDIAANINYGTLERAIDLSQEAIRRLGQQWL